MGLQRVWPIGLFLFLPAIVLLYFLKQKARPREVSSLYLWREVYRNVQASSPWERLKKNWLMLLQLLTMFFLASILLGPYLSFGGTRNGHAILLIDNSGSMNAKYDGKDASRLEMAKAKALQYVEGVKRGTRVSVIACGDYPDLLAANVTDRNELKRAIQGVQATCVKGDVEAALSLASSMTAEYDDCQAVLYTDSDVSLDDLRADVVDLSSGGRNGTLHYLSHTDSGEEVRILAKVGNTGTKEWESDVNLYLDEVLLQVRTLRLLPGESEIVHFDPVPAQEFDGRESLSLSAKLQEKDDLNEDNEAYDFVRKTENAKVLLITEQNVFLEKAALSAGNLELYKSSETEMANDGEGFDLVIYDGVVPERLPEQGSLIFINPDKGVDGLFQIEKRLNNVEVQAVEHEVSRYMEDFRFGLGELSAIRRPDWATPFFKSGEYGAGFVGKQGGRNVAVLAFDLHQTDLPLLTEFPILMNNLFRFVVDARMLSSDRVEAGESVSVYRRGDSESLRVTLPDGSETTMEGQRAVTAWEETKQAGLYEFEEERTDGRFKESLAVEFPKGESVWNDSITVTESGGAGREQKKGAGYAQGRSLENILLTLVFLLLLWEWFVYIRGVALNGFSWRKYGGRMAVRLVLFALLLLAWVDPAIIRRSNAVTTVFLVDVSDSTTSHHAEAERFVGESIRGMPGRNQAGVVAFGSDSKVEQFVSRQKRFEEFQTKPVATATNLEQAVQTAMSLFSERSAKRLVLISDGKENAGTLSNMGANLRSNQVEVLVWKLDEAGGDEVYVSDMKIPEKIRVGDRFPIQVEVTGNVSTNAVLRLFAGQTEIASQTISLEKGENVFLFQEEAVQSGVASYRAFIEPAKDTVSVNNEYVAFTEAEEGNEILLIEGALNKGDEFVKVLKAANIPYQRILPDIAPEDVHAMNAYSCIVLLDVHAQDLTEGFLANLESYVKDYAGGLVAVGGENSFALGAYQDTPLETVLPVKMDLEGVREIPKMALAMVIDHSGSMSEVEGGVSRLAMAKEAAVGTLQSLREEDMVGVLAFDDTYDWMVGMQNPASREEITQRIDAIPMGGGTSVYPALEEASKEVGKLDAKIKHVILLTDGQDEYRDYGGLIQQMGEDGVTLSTVAVGTGADADLLANLAKEGGGRAYVSNLTTDLPRIFMKEVFLSTGEYLKNKEFTPQIASTGELLKDVAKEGLPSMRGYVASTRKPLATSHLVSDEEDPILTTWQYGLGKTAAFQSDGENKWTASYAAWEEYPAFWRNIIDGCTTQKGGEGADLQIRQKGNVSSIRYVSEEYSADSVVEAAYTDAQGKQRRVTLEAAAPGTFTADVELSQVGVYGVNVTRKEGGEVKDTRNSAMALQYSAEYRFVETEDVLEDFVNATDGRFIQGGESVFSSGLRSVQTRFGLKSVFLVLAVFWFYFDIANRRLYPSLLERGLARMGIIGKYVDVWREQEREEAGEKPSKTKKGKPKKESKSKLGASKQLDVETLLDKKRKRN